MSSLLVSMSQKWCTVSENDPHAFVYAYIHTKYRHLHIYKTYGAYICSQGHFFFKPFDITVIYVTYHRYMHHHHMYMHHNHIYICIITTDICIITTYICTMTTGICIITTYIYAPRQQIYATQPDVCIIPTDIYASYPYICITDTHLL